MGFFDKALNILGGAAAGFLVGGPGGAAAGAVAGLTGTTPTAAATAAVGGLGSIGQTLISAPAVQQDLAVGRAVQDAAILAAAAPTGMQKNMVRTIVQTVAPNGKIVRATVLKGRPYLMNSDFVVLKRTLKLIGIAEERVPRPRTRGQKAAKDQAHTRGMLEGLVAAGNPTQALLTHHAND